MTNEERFELMGCLICVDKGDYMIEWKSGW